MCTSESVTINKIKNISIKKKKKREREKNSFEVVCFSGLGIALLKAPVALAFWFPELGPDTHHHSTTSSRVW